MKKTKLLLATLILVTALSGCVDFLGVYATFEGYEAHTIDDVEIAGRYLTRSEILEEHKVDASLHSAYPSEGEPIESKYIYYTIPVLDGDSVYICAIIRMLESGFEFASIRNEGNTLDKEEIVSETLHADLLHIKILIEDIDLAEGPVFMETQYIMIFNPENDNYVQVDLRDRTQRNLHYKGFCFVPTT